MNYDKIKELAKKKKLSMNEVLRRANISAPGFYQMIENDRMKIKVLEKISEVLGVSPKVFFEEDPVPGHPVIKEKPISGNSLSEMNAKVVIQIELDRDQANKVLEMVLGKKNQ